MPARHPLPVWCALCTGAIATQRRYPPPSQYRRTERGTPLCDGCAVIWDSDNPYAVDMWNSRKDSGR